MKIADNERGENCNALFSKGLSRTDSRGGQIEIKILVRLGGEGGGKIPLFFRENLSTKGASAPLRLLLNTPIRSLVIRSTAQLCYI